MNKPSLVVLFFLKAYAFSAVAQESSPQTLIDWMSRWRNSLSGYAVTYAVTTESFNIHRRSDTGEIRTDVPRIKVKTKKAIVEIECSSTAILERIYPKEILLDGVPELSSLELYSAELLVKGDETVYFTPKDSRVSLKQGRVYTVPFIHENIEKLILLDGLLFTFLQQSDTFKIEKSSGEVRFTVASGAKRASMSVRNGRPSYIELALPSQLVSIKYEYTDESTFPSVIRFSASYNGQSSPFTSTVWKATGIKEIDPTTDLKLAIPKDAKISDKRSLNQSENGRNE